jgi:predicted DNA-binding transcriptional regulator YafY
LSVIVHQGNQGGIELGFNYRTRLTGLAADEAEALAVILGQPAGVLDELGMRQAGNRAVGKLVESFPDRVRDTILRAMEQFRFDTGPAGDDDPRLSALAQAVRGSRIVTVQARSSSPRRIHPAALVYGPDGWRVVDASDRDRPVRLADCGDINISAKRFA